MSIVVGIVQSNNLNFIELWQIIWWRILILVLYAGTGIIIIVCTHVRHSLSWWRIWPCLLTQELVLLLCAHDPPSSPRPPPKKSSTSKSTMAPSFSLTTGALRHLRTNRPSHPRNHDMDKRLLAVFGPTHPNSGATAAKHWRAEVVFDHFHHVVSSRWPWHANGEDKSCNIVCAMKIVEGGTKQRCNYDMWIRFFAYIPIKSNYLIDLFAYFSNPNCSRSQTRRWHNGKINGISE